MKLLSAFLPLALIMPLSPAVAADDACPPRETILSFNDIVLADRSGLPPLAARRFGAEAAYLKIRYAPLPDADTRSLLQALLAANVRAADDLAYAWHISKDGYDAAIAALGEKQFDLLISTFGTSTLRALLLREGDQDVLMKRIAPAARKLMSNVAGAISTAVVDQPDAIKEKIALAAEAQDLPQIAAYLTAIEQSPEAWEAFLARRAGKEDPQVLTQTVHWMPAMVGNPSLKRSEYNIAREKTHRITMAGALEPERDFLLTLMNQTGKLEEVHAVAETLMEQIESGAIRRNGTLDAAWLLAYRGLVDGLGGRSQVDPVLGIIAFSGTRYVRPAGIFYLSDVIDRLLVVEALQPYVTGTTDDMPSPPPELSEKMKADWVNWSAMATIVRGGTVSPGLAADPAMFGIVTELLFAKADWAALTAFVGQAPPGEPRISVANDLAMRLDRQCASYLSHPGEALLLSGQPIFKFDTP